MTDVRAVSTRYAGCHFRSRLEARWAVFFDALGIAWHYEPQGFAWPAGEVERWSLHTLQGGSYLPDFWLPTIETWFEVKGTMPDDEEWRIIHEFAIVVDQRHITAVGDIPRSVDELDCNHSESMYLNAGMDFHYLWCICPWCGKPGIEFDGRGGRVCPGEHDCVGPCTGEGCAVEAIEHYRGRPSDKAYTFDAPRILAAYAAARSARFEHGESGAT